MLKGGRGTCCQKNAEEEKASCFWFKVREKKNALRGKNQVVLERERDA